jgi:hypothetical protein
MPSQHKQRIMEHQMSEPGLRHPTPRWRLVLEGQAGYWIGLTTVALGILIRWLLNPILGQRVAFVTLFLALVLAHFADVETIYIAIEPDQGGKAVERWLDKSAIRDRASS